MNHIEQTAAPPTEPNGPVPLDYRSAAADDAAALAALSHELGYGPGVDDTRAWLAEMLASPQHAVYVAAPADAQGLAGWMALERHLSLEAGPAAVISGLVVGAAWRRRGIGRSFLRLATSWARERGLARINLSSNIVRPESHGFYLDYGFARTKTAHHYALQLVPRPGSGASAQ